MLVPVSIPINVSISTIKTAPSYHSHEAHKDKLEEAEDVCQISIALQWNFGMSVLSFKITCKQRNSIILNNF